MKRKTLICVLLLSSCLFLVQGATAIFDDYWDKTMSDESWVPGPGNLFPDWNGTTPKFAPWPFGDRPEWNATPRFDFNDSAYERFRQRVLPDRNSTRSRYVFNDTPIGPGFGYPISPAVILSPILHPIAIKLGIHPIHFGTIVVVNFVIGYITPPFAYNLFVAKSITGMTMDEVSAAVVPFLLVSLLGLILITYIPEVSLFFPRLFMGP